MFFPQTGVLEILMDFDFALGLKLPICSISHETSHRVYVTFSHYLNYLNYLGLLDASVENVA